MQSAIKEARSVIDREQVIHLSRRDCERLLDTKSLLEGIRKKLPRMIPCVA